MKTLLVIGSTYSYLYYFIMWHKGIDQSIFIEGYPKIHPDYIFEMVECYMVS